MSSTAAASLDNSSKSKSKKRSSTATEDSTTTTTTTTSTSNTDNNNNNTKAAKRLKPTVTSANAASSNNVRVVARVRPLSTKETNEQSQQAIQVVETLEDVATSIQVSATGNSRSSSNKTFEYDACFDPTTTQQQLYHHTVGDLVQTNIFKGFNVTVMAYGQTGSGKTFTMGTEGGAAVATKTETLVDLVPPVDSDGIIPRAVYDLFETRRSLPRGTERVSVELSYLEIYNEEARDLLAPEGSATTNLHIRDRPDGVMVQGLSTRPVHSPQDVSTLMNQAALKRATASTAMNAVSSRSHAICTLYVTIKPLEQDSSSDASNAEEMRAKLTLVDLAGSERIKRTGAEGKRLKEGININKGLFVLGQVVSALSELGQQGNSASSSNSHIPYRDSKLTRLLQDSLGGNSRTVMVACISPADSNAEESINTLRYAQRTRNIQNSARRNVISTTTSMSAAEAAALKRENQVLQLQLAQAQAKLAAVGTTTITTETSSTVGADSTNSLMKMETNDKRNDVNGIDMSKLDTIRRLQSTISSLESKVEALEEQQQSTADDVLDASMRADKWQWRYEELVKAAKEQGVTLPENTTTADGTSNSADDTTTPNTLDLVSQLRKEISDLKSDLREAISDAAVARATAAAIVAGNGDFEAASQYVSSSNSSNDESTDASMDNSSDEEADKEEKLAMTAELVALSGGIEAKEAMVLQMNKERECMESMRSHFENAVKSLQEEVDVLSTERESLLSKVAADGTTKSGQLSEDKKQMKNRIDQLESRIKELRHKAAEHTKSLKLREAAEKKCAQLTTEIQAAKKRRVDLQKQLKEQASERRSEKAAAKKEAMKLMRDSNRLKVELEKVKNAATKQANVLRRKATEALNKQKREAERQAKKQEQQAQRKQLAALKSNAKDKTSSAESSLPSSDQYSFNNSNNISEERKTELLEWLEEEIETASALKETQDQINEQKRLMNEAIAEKAGLSTNNSLMRSSGNLAVNPPSKALAALEEEIEMRSSLIDDLENNLSDILSSSMASPRARSPSPRSSGSGRSHFLDMNLYQGLTKPEATAVFLQCFDRLLKLKKDMSAVQSVHENNTSRAVQNALNKERRVHEETIMQLKMDHSQAMMDLLNSTKGSLEQSVRLNSLKSVVDPEFQSTVEEMLGSYLQGCSKAGESLQGELLEVRQAQEGMKKMVESVTSGLLSDTNPTPQKKKSKKKKPKKRDSSDSILEEIKLLEMDDEEADNSDDSDWSPSNKTPGPKRRSRRSADSDNKDSKRRSNELSSKYSAVVELDSIMAPVAEEEQAPKKQPGTVTFQDNESSLDVSGVSNPAEEDSFERDEDAQGPSESVTDYANLKVRELKDLLRSRGLVVSGIKTELIERLEEDDRNRLGLTDVVDLTQDDSPPEAPNSPSDEDWFSSKENEASRRTSMRTARGQGLRNRDLNKPLDEPEASGKTSAKAFLPSTPPKSTQKVGGWSTKKIASVRRSTIFSSKKRSPLPSSSPDSSVESRHENDENVEPSNKRHRKSSLKTLRTRRNLGVQLGTNNGV